MRFLPALRNRSEVVEVERDQTQYTLDEYMGLLNEFYFNGLAYFTQGAQQTQPGQRQEPIGPAYAELSSLAYKTDSVVFACMATRALHFAEGRFQFRQMNNGRPGKLFGTQDLQPLEEPWVGGTTGDLLARMILHADLGGNAFVVRKDAGVALLRPDWVTIVIGSDADPEMGAWDTAAEILGYVYSPGGFNSADTTRVETYLPDQVAHFAPYPDPQARFRGMSWLTPLIREVMADKAGTEHKLQFFQNPTPNMHVKFEVPSLEEFKAQVQAFKEAHGGARNAYKTMFTASGVDVTPVGVDMQKLDYRLVTGAGETRIAAAARTPPVIVGLSEGLQGSALNSGNYQAARRMFADGCIRPLWRNAAASLANIITVPGGAELFYDDRDVAFLREDATERADVMQKKSQTVRYLVDAGYKPDTVIAAVESEDFSMLEHSGLFSVQLQAANAPRQGLFTGAVVPSGQTGPTSGETGGNGNGTSPNPTNGNGNGRALDLYELEERIYRNIGSSNGDTHVHFDEGAFRMEIPERENRIEVHPSDVNITVEQPEAPTVELRNEVTPPDVNVTVEAAEAPQVNLDLEPLADGLRALAEKDTNVTVEVPERSVTVNVPEQERSDIVVNVPEQAAPSVTVQVPDQPAPVVNVNIEDEPLDATVRFRRDGQGQVSSAEIKENQDTNE